VTNRLSTVSPFSTIKLPLFQIPSGSCVLFHFLFWIWKKEYIHQKQQSCENVIFCITLIVRKFSLVSWTM